MLAKQGRQRTQADGGARVRFATAWVPDPVDPCSSNEGVDYLGVELDPGELSQLRERLFRGQWCHSIGSFGGHGFESVGHVEDSSESRDLLSNQPVRVARP